MNKIFIGFLLVIFDFHITRTNITNGMLVTTRLNIIPDFLGYFVMYAGLTEIRNISRRFEKMLPFVLVLGLYHAFNSALIMLRVSIILQPATALILTLILMFLPLIIWHNIVMGVREIDGINFNLLNSAQLYTAWKLFLAISMILVAPLYIRIPLLAPLTEMITSAFLLVLVIYFGFFINFMVKFYRMKKLFYQHGYDRFYSGKKGNDAICIQTTCVGCPQGCNLNFYTEHGELKLIEPTFGYPVNKYFDCAYGLDMDRQQAGVGQSILPMIKQPHDGFEQVDWDTAVLQAAGKLLQVKEVHGSDSIAVEYSGQMTLEETALLRHVTGDFLGANGHASCSASAEAYTQSFGYNAPPYTLGDIGQSETIILIGFNPAITYPNIWRRIAQTKLPNKKLITIDTSVYTETSKNVNYHYKIHEGSYLSLMYTLAKIMIDNDWINTEYIEEYTEGFAEFKEFLADYTLDRATAETGLSQEQIMNLAAYIGRIKSRAVSFWWSDEVAAGQDGVGTAQAIINLALMSGNMGRAGTGANYVPTDFGNIFSMNRIIEKIHSGQLQALWLIDNDRHRTWLNNDEFKQAAKKLELFVVSTPYCDAESNIDCDILLPIVPPIQNEGTCVNIERRLSALQPVIARAEGELTAYEVILRVGQALGMNMSLEGWQTANEAFDMLRAATAGKPNDITGVNYSGLKGLIGSRGIQWPFGEYDILLSDERRLFEDGIYYTPNKKAKFIFK